MAQIRCTECDWQVDGQEADEEIENYGLFEDEMVCPQCDAGWEDLDITY